MRISHWSSDVCSSDLYCDVLPDEMFRAVCDVSTASWRVVDEIYRRLNGREEAEIQEHLRERLVSVFGQPSVKYEHKILSASSNDNRKSDVSGKSVSVRGDHGGRRINQKKKRIH